MYQECWYTIDAWCTPGPLLPQEGLGTRLTIHYNHMLCMK